LDSGAAIARQTKVILEQEDLVNDKPKEVRRIFYTNKNTAVLQNILDEFDENLKAIKIDF
jgi:glutamate racemase